MGAPAPLSPVAVGQNGGFGTVVLTLPPGIADGNLLIVELQASVSGNTFTDAIAKGWWSHASFIIGTREVTVLSRIYRTADAASTYTLTLSASTGVAWLAGAVQAHAVTVKSDILVSAPWRRADNGGAVGLITMPSITTPIADYLAIGLTGEATNSVGTYSVTSDQGFTAWGVRPADVVIEELTAWYKVVTPAGPSGAQAITYTIAFANGGGIQLAIPPIVPVPPAGPSFSGDNAYYVANSGLTPASRYSLSDHRAAWFRAQGFTGSVADMEYAYLIQRSGSNDRKRSLADLRMAVYGKVG